MKGRVLAFLFPRMPAEFPSDYPIAESVGRLQVLVSPFTPEIWFDHGTTGAAAEDNVRLERTTVFSHAFRMYLRFSGSFRQNENGVVLSGYFSTRGWGWTNFKLTLGFFAVWMIIMIPATLLDPTERWRFPLVGTAVFALNACIFKLGRRFALKDAEWLSRAIVQALTKPESLPDLPPRKPSRIKRWLEDLQGQ